jgi:hypothetical protein
LGGKRAGPHAKNLLFFGDIRDLPIKTFNSELRQRYYPDETGAISNYIGDLTIQLHVNSDIAMRKMRLFSISVGFISVAAFSLLVPSINLAIRAVR